MQFLTLLATTAFAAFATALPNRLAPRGDPPAEGGSFKDHCYGYTVGKLGEIYGRLTAYCGDDLSSTMTHTTWLDLNLCLGNYNGELTWQDNGNAIATSCKDCKSRHFDAQWIECSCMDVTGAYKSTSLDLNAGVRYDADRNVLACFENFGVLVH